MPNEGDVEELRRRIAAATAGLAAAGLAFAAYLRPAIEPLRRLAADPEVQRALRSFAAAEAQAEKGTATFSEVLRRLREDAGLTQQQLADKAGMPVGSLRNHEQGQRLPSWAAVVKLAKALGVSTEAFADCDEVKGEDEPPPDAKKRPRK